MAKKKDSKLKLCGWRGKEGLDRNIQDMHGQTYHIKTSKEEKMSTEPNMPTIDEIPQETQKRPHEPHEGINRVF